MAGSYTPINATAAPGVDYNAHQQEVEKEKANRQANPELNDYSAAGVVHDGSGKDTTNRVTQAGASGADEDLMLNADYAAIQEAKAAYAAAQAAGDQAGMDAAHTRAEQIRSGYGYSGGSDGSQYLTLGELGINRQGNSGTGTGTGYGASGAASASGGSGAAGRYDTSGLTDLLEQWKAAALEQSNGQIDYAVQQAVTQLERALEDAQPQFKEQAETVAKDERQALDNSALYAEARGDKGGIGQSQYNEIQAAAAQNRLAVQQAQTKLATDTARQIEDLRAQGEFEKADKALEISQSYLSQLVSLEQWAAEYNLSYDQFQASLEQWQAEYELAMAQFQVDTDLAYGQLTGTIPSTGQLTLSGQSQLASMGEALLSAGIMPNNEQLSAMGMTESQAQSYLTAQQLQQASGSYSSGGKTGTTSTTTGSETENQTGYDALFEAARASGYARSYINNHYKEYGFSSSTGLYDDYGTWLEQTEAAEQAAGDEAGLSDLNTASVTALGLGAISYATVEQMVQQGVLTVYDAGSKLGVKWADGWDAEKYRKSSRVTAGSTFVKGA